MRRVIVGTAGHVDHGKTMLVKALTGVDCDRWREEKDRGITIDLGFAVLRHEDLQIGFVDVPGHERFLHNALAGLGGIRIMLLVVSAEEGVKPQTREHLGVCSLLGIPAGVVALTKTDLVAEDLVELAQLEVEELLEGTPFEGSPVIPVSSVSGSGLPELEAKLVELAETHEVRPDPEQPVRLPIDRAFHLKGLGVVVTGTLVTGSVHPGDALTLLPRGEVVRLRSVQVHGESREEAAAGERTSLQVTGVELDELARGMQIVEPGRFEPGNRLLVSVRLLPEAPVAIDAWTPIRLHLYSGQIMGELRPLSAQVLEPGAEAVAEVRLAAPAVSVRGDRFIVTRPSPATTLGGGRVLDPRWRRRRGKLLEEALGGLAGDDEAALVQWVKDAGERGAGAAELARRLGWRPARVAAALSEMAAEGTLLEVPEAHGHERRWLAARAYARVTERARRVLDDYFRRDRLARGIPKAEAIRRILPGRAAELSATYLGWLEKQKVVAIAGDLVTLPGRQVELSGEESDLAKKVLERYRGAGLEPPAPSEVAVDLSAKPQILEGVVRYLLERGDLVRLPGGLFIAGSAIEELRRDLLATGWERFDVAAFKDRFGLSRKWAIPLLEHLDSGGFTRRLGDQRMIVPGT